MRTGFFLLCSLLLITAGRSHAQVIHAQRTSGTAPLGIHFTVNETDWDVLKGSDYEWIFPDGDTVSGFQAVHTFLDAGTVKLNITRADFSKYTESMQISVDAPDTYYPGTRTTCISTSGNFSGCPAGAATVTAANLTGITFAVRQRFLFREGEHFDLSGSKTLFANSYISSYGNAGGKAVIRVSGDATTTTFWMQDSITVSHIDFQGSEWVLSPAWGGTMYGEGRLFAPENHTTLYDIGVRDMTAFVIMDDGIGAKKNLVVDGVTAENLGSYFLYAGASPSIEYSGVRNSRVFNVMSNHGIRLNGGRYFIANRMHIDSVDRSQITYRGLRYGIVSDSRFTGKGLYKNSIRNISDDASVRDTVRYIIYERNRYESRPNEFALDFNIGSDIVVRNNLLLNSSFNIGVNHSGVIPQYLEIVHNTFYQNNYEWYPQIILRGGSNGSFEGNIAYADDCNGGCAADNPFGGASNPGPALWNIDYNAYYVSGDASGANFKSGMSFATWQVSGFDAGGSYGDMQFVNKSSALALADFKPMAGGMQRLTPFLTHRDLWGNRRHQTAGNDAGAVESDPVTSLSVSVRDAPASFSVYPNPVVDYLQLTGNVAYPVSCVITDPTGRVVSTTPLVDAGERIRVAHLSGGIYFLNVKEKNGVAGCVKFVK